MIRGCLPYVLRCIFLVVVGGVLAVVLFFPWTFFVSAAAVLPLFPSRMSPGYAPCGFPLYVEDRVFMSLGWDSPMIPSRSFPSEALPLVASFASSACGLSVSLFEAPVFVGFLSWSWVWGLLTICGVLAPLCARWRWPPPVMIPFVFRLLPPREPHGTEPVSVSFPIACLVASLMGLNPG